jgi:hypothetical protein
MKEPIITKKNEIDWYVSLRPIERYLNIERENSLLISKFGNIKSEKDSHLREK